MHQCPRCGTPWTTAWLADPKNCEVCNPYQCEQCPERYPSERAAFLCCRD